MKKQLIILVFAVFPAALAGQQSAEVGPWVWSVMAGLNGSQAAYSNWVQGGVNSVAATSSAVFSGKYTAGKLRFSSDLNLKYGGARIDNAGFQKTDDVIHWQNLLNYQMGASVWSYYASAGFMSQFYEGKNAGVVQSKFFAPAYVNEGLGIGYDPVLWFGARAGLAMKQTIVRDSLFAAGFGVRSGQTFRNEAGLTLGFRLEKPVMENVLLKSSGESFTNLQRSFSHSDFLWNNELIGKINKYLSMTLQLAFMFDDDIINKVQVKQVLSAGLQIQLL